MGSFARTRGLVPLRFRLRASFWTSCGVVGLLLVCQVAWRQFEGEEDSFGRDGLMDTSAKPRRLDISPVYPNDLVLTKPYYEDPHRWLVILHCIAIGYMLVGLNTVCDVYFTGALDVLVEEWKVQADVAGATFMAAGGSMPELFTSIIGVAVESDVGFSTIVGSAVFNVLFVIGLCGYYAKTDMDLWWWPLARDCSYYIVSLMFLAWFCFDKKVVLHEALILFGLYILYCIIMYNNTKLYACVCRIRGKKTSRVVPEDGQEEVDGAETKTAAVAAAAASEKIKEHDTPTVDVDRHDPPEATPEATPECNTNEEKEEKKEGEGEEVQGEDSVGKKGTGKSKASDEEDEPFNSFLQRPEGTRDQIVYYLSVPVYMILYYAIPEPTPKWFMLTFVLSLIWIALFAFVLVWCVEILADVVFRGSEAASVIMGFTILAAGTSIPDAVSSVAVAVKGQGDMAVSSSIGSNIFDILFGLPVPWIIKILLRVKDANGVPKTFVAVNSPFIFFYVLLLLIMVFLTISSIHLVGWKLNKRLGLCMAGLYGIFLAIALAVEFLRPEWLKWN